MIDVDDDWDANSLTYYVVIKNPKVINEKYRIWNSNNGICTFELIVYSDLPYLTYAYNLYRDIGKHTVMEYACEPYKGGLCLHCCKIVDNNRVTDVKI